MGGHAWRHGATKQKVVHEDVHLIVLSMSLTHRRVFDPSVCATGGGKRVRVEENTTRNNHGALTDRSFQKPTGLYHTARHQQGCMRANG